MIVILGGGLAGMSTAYHLARQQPGVPRVVLERESEPGGLCRSRRVDGFTFDYTGHYLHLRDPEIVAWVERLLGDELVEVERTSAIHCRGTRLAFPFQANLHGLPAEVVARCIVDFVRAKEEPEPERSGKMPFGKWARRVFGDSIAEEFMIPYNTKQFGVDADEITAEWVAWAVPRPDLGQVVRGALGQRNDGLGYNPRFRYPRRGGIGVLPERLAAEIGSDLRVGASVESVDARARTVTLAGGERIEWSALVSTIPLPQLLARTEGLDDGGSPLGELAARLRWNAVVDLRLGVDRAEIAGGAHWIYFPEPQFPFYRVGFPSNVCGAMAPEGRSSMSIEFCHRSGAPIPRLEELVAAARAGLERAGILAPADAVVTAEAVVLDPAYVLFDEHRTPVVTEALHRLEKAGILSVGRFGAWTYSYMERALLDGRQAAERLSGVVTA